jgi:hypothetical protein
VRRQVYADKDAHSFGRLLLEISEKPELLTRELCLGGSTARDPLDAMAQRTWMDVYGGAVGDHLDPAIPQADLERLRSESARVVGWVDRHVAHSDRRPIPADHVPTLDDVHAGVEVIGEMYSRYYPLLTRVSWAMLVPALQHDWMAALDLPRFGGHGVLRRPWSRLLQSI